MFRYVVWLELRDQAQLVPHNVLAPCGVTKLFPGVKDATTTLGLVLA